MAVDRIPTDLIPSSGSHVFTQDTIPEALKKEHKLASGHWGVLHVFEGSLKFVDIASGKERTIEAPNWLRFTRKRRIGWPRMGR